MRFNKILNRFVLMVDDDKEVGGPGYLDESEDDDIDLKSMVESDDDDDGTEDADKELSSDENSAEKEQEEKGKPGEKTVFTKEELEEAVRVATQAAVDRVIARERSRAEENEQRIRQEAEIERQKKEYDAWYQAEFSKKLKRYEETLGLDEETAKRLAAEDMQGEIRHLQIQWELEERRKADEANQARLKYNEDIANLMQSNPLIAKFKKEIDEISGHGTSLSADVAASYVLGKKIMGGELLGDIKATTEQKTIANINKRQKAVVQSGSQPGAKANEPRLTRDEQRIARALGLKDSEYEAGKKTRKR